MERAEAESQRRPGISFTIDRLLSNEGEPSSQGPELKDLQETAEEKTKNPIPEPSGAPVSVDLLGKPNQSYVALISTAILSSPAKKLLLSDIYRWIMDNHPYFRNKEKSWRNRVRHNLSLNECFIKAGHSNNGKGHFWTIHPDNLEDFSKGIYHRRAARRGIQRMAANLGSHQPYVPNRHGLACRFLGQCCLSCSLFPHSACLDLPEPCRPLFLWPSSVSWLHPFLAGGSGERSKAKKKFSCWSSSHPQITAPSWPVWDSKVIKRQPLDFFPTRGPPPLQPLGEKIFPSGKVGRRLGILVQPFSGGNTMDGSQDLPGAPAPELHGQFKRDLMTKLCSASSTQKL